MKPLTTIKAASLFIQLFFCLIISINYAYSQAGETCNAGDDFYAPLCNPIYINLNEYLSNDADSGGTWNTQSGSDSDLNISSDGIVNLSSKNHKTVSFTYTIAANDGSCDDVAYISFEVDRVSAGENGELDILAGSTVDADKLFTALNGEPTAGGSWSPAFGGANTYTYTQEAKYGCSEQSATVTVNEFTTLTAGDDIGHNICQDPGVINLDNFVSTKANKGGSWTIKENDGDGDGAILKKPRNLDFGGLGAGNFTFKMGYSVDDPSSDVSTSEVTINVDVPDDAGEDGTLTICTGDTVTYENLYAALNGTPSEYGAWTPNTIDSNVYVYTYTHGDIKGCNNTAIVTVTEEIPKSAGLDGTLKIATGSTVTQTQLFEALEGTPDTNGNWSPTLAGAGIYTYTQDATALCPLQSATVTVTISTLSVNEDLFSKLSLHPNPSKDKLFLTGDNLPMVREIEFYSIQGQLVKRVNNSFDEIDISNFKSALYLVKINTEIGVGTIKLIKY